MVDVYASEGLAEARAEEERRQMRVKPKMTGDDFVYQVCSYLLFTWTSWWECLACGS